MNHKGNAGSLTLSSVLISWDIVAAILAAIVTHSALPRWVDNVLAKDLYNTGIPILTILFAVFFAALAIIISTGDSEFVLFLEEVGDYATIVAVFKLSLLALSFALVGALALYTYTTVRISLHFTHQSRWFLSLFTGIFVYALWVALASTFHAIKFSEQRVKFARAVRDAHAAKKIFREPNQSEMDGP